MARAGYCHATRSLRRASAYALLRLTLCLLPVCLAGGLAATTEDVEGEDHEAVFPSFRLEWRILPREEPPTVQEAAGEDTSNGSETPAVGALFSWEIVDFAFGCGDSSQTLGAGEYIYFEDFMITGPASVTTEYDLSWGATSVRGGASFYDLVDVEGILGVGYQYLGVELSSGTIEDGDTHWSVGPVTGARLAVRPMKWLTLYGDGRVLAGLGPTVGSGLYAEGGVSIHPTENVGISAGWRYWRAGLDRGGLLGGSASDADVKLSGPALGLRISF